MSVDISPTDGFPNMYNFINDKATKTANPVMLVILTFVIISYYILFSYLGISGSTTPSPQVGNSSGINVIEIMMWGLFIFLILVNGLQYFFNLDIKASLSNVFSGIPEVDLQVTSPSLTETGDGKNDSPITASNTIPEITYKSQVYHIPKNIYNYTDAKAVCKAYGSRLATITEVQESYKDGAEWCGYGWSDEQMALYPTQTASWKKFQKIKGHENDCGRPGVNGGYIANPNVRFGVNCYGYKPKITTLEKKLMDTNVPYPLNPAERCLEDRIKYYKNKLSNILVSPFNYDNWSQI